MFVDTPKPPYYAVIFSSQLKENHDGYGDTITKMLELAKDIEGYIGIESPARTQDRFGISVSYWESEAAIKRWRDHMEHTAAREYGKKHWYQDYVLRVAKVERAYGMAK
jgi:heme-degrading monooxygenase HmoA